MEAISECIQAPASGSFGAWRRESSASAGKDSTVHVLRVDAKVRLAGHAAAPFDLKFLRIREVCLHAPQSGACQFDAVGLRVPDEQAARPVPVPALVGPAARWPPAAGYCTRKMG